MAGGYESVSAGEVADFTLATAGGNEGYPVKRHRSLHPLSVHHHHALVQALNIRRAEEAPEAERSAALERAGHTLLQHWKMTGQKHFREEEEILLPAFSRHTELNEDPTVMRMSAQHAMIRAEMEQLEILLSSKQPVDTEVIAIGKLLHDNVRLEEDNLFPHIEAELTEEELLALGHKFTRLHGVRKE